MLRFLNFRTNVNSYNVKKVFLIKKKSYGKYLNTTIQKSSLLTKKEKKNGIQKHALKTIVSRASSYNSFSNVWSLEMFQLKNEILVQNLKCPKINRSMELFARSFVKCMETFENHSLVSNRLKHIQFQSTQSTIHFWKLGEWHQQIRVCIENAF